MPETLRSRSVIQGGVPHVVSEEDSYKGDHISQDFVVIPNGWALSHEVSIFPNPEEYWIQTPSLPVSAWGFVSKMPSRK
jgi:cytochrome P450